MPSYFEVLAEAALSRSRSSWNDRLWHWERPASDTEEAKIERAAKAARDMIASSAILVEDGVSIQPQGSYFNNTNVRLEADMDLRVQLPVIYTDYSTGIDVSATDRELGYVSTGRSISEATERVRKELARISIDQFGEDNVDVGNKAVTVSGLDYYADVDLVPALRLHWIYKLNGELYKIEGVAIIGKDGKITQNFPRQHNENGKAKRESTSHRFKKIVRMLKRLNGELAELSLIEKAVPSFFVECLVYCVEDEYFLHEEDRYMRFNRILARLQVLLSDAEWIKSATEVNEIKYLFHFSQPWSVDLAKSFVQAALSRLEA